MLLTLVVKLSPAVLPFHVCILITNVRRFLLPCSHLQIFFDRRDYSQDRKITATQNFPVQLLIN